MKHAIIIGASSGIGLEVARLLLNDGWTLGVAARRQEPLEELAGEYPGKVKTAAIDVNSPDAPAQLLSLVADTGGINLYFHAAGVGWRNPSLEPSKEIATVQTNALGFTQMIDAAFQYMAQNGGGHIAVISSIAGTKGLGEAPAYSATKALQNTYIQALEQLAVMNRLNIRFTDIRPGFVRTNLLSGESFPLLMQPADVARKIVKAIYRQKHIAVIDWRWRMITAAWRRIPRFLWRILPIRKK